MKLTTGKFVCMASIALIMAATLGVVGCGSSSDSTGSSSGSTESSSGASNKQDALEKSQFIAQANSICKNSAAKREKALSEAGEQEPAELATEVALPPVQQMTEELGELAPPAGEEEEVQAIVAAFEGGFEKVEANPSDVTTDVTAFAQADSLAEEYGLNECVI